VAERRYAPAQAKLSELLLRKSADLRKYAEQGNAVDQYDLGTCYEYGYGGVAKNLEEAVKRYRKAAKQGNHDAQARLRELSLRKSAEQGNAVDQYDLGCGTNMILVVVL
jgi:TPR repeat protein